VGTGVNGEPIFPVLAQSPETTVVDMSVNSGSMSSNGELKWDSIFRGYDLERRLLVVEPGKTLGLNMVVTTRTATGTDSGRRGPSCLPLLLRRREAGDHVRPRPAVRNQRPHGDARHSLNEFEKNLSSALTLQATQ
jgi:hypothetical protein